MSSTILWPCYWSFTGHSSFITNISSSRKGILKASNTYKKLKPLGKGAFNCTVFWSFVYTCLSLDYLCSLVSQLCMGFVLLSCALNLFVFKNSVFVKLNSWKKRKKRTNQIYTCGFHDVDYFLIMELMNHKVANWEI